MKTYVIRREKAWQNGEELEADRRALESGGRERLPRRDQLDPQLRDRRAGRHPRHRLHLPGKRTRRRFATTPSASACPPTRSSRSPTRS